MKNIHIFLIALILCLSISIVYAEPNIVEYKNADVSVSGNKIRATVYIRNDGSSMAQEWLIELQPRVYTLSWVSPQDVCDPNNPQNVHRRYRLSNGESISFTLESTVSSGKYNVYLVSADKCCPTYPDCQSTSPYYWGEYQKTVSICSNCDYEYCEGNIAWKNPQCQGSVCVRQGIDCTAQGKICQESDNTANCVSTCTDDCTWGHMKCLNNEKWYCAHDCDTDPCNEWCYASTCPAGTVCVEVSDTNLQCQTGTTTVTTTIGTTTLPQPNIIEYSSAGISVIENKIIVTMYLKNTGASMTQDWLVELQPRISGTLSWVSPQYACDPQNPQNVHKKYKLDSGESVQITLESTVTSGTYNVYLVSADSCCPSNPSCISTDPYHWGVFKKSVTIGAQCNNNWIWEPGEDLNCMDTIITIILIVVIISVAIIVAYAIRRKKK